MNKQKQMVNDFLKKYKMDYESIDIEKGCEDFIKDMENGLEGNTSSLKMIPTYITIDREIPLEEPVIVMDAGGTNFRVAVAYFDKNKKVVIEDYNNYPMPGTNGEIPKEEFFTTMVNYLKPVLNKSNKIGFCFSYATEVLPNKDGKLIQFSKEVRVTDLIGEKIGENLLKTIKDMGYEGDKEIVLFNDTVATLLGGKASYLDRVFDGYIGFILGTGTNTAYIEDNSNIKKSKDISSKKGSMIINVESGGYEFKDRGDIDLEFDSSTKDPGQYTFEKMISGRYQGGILLETVKKAAQEGLFSKNFTDKILKLDDLTTIEMNDFLFYPYSGNVLADMCGDNEDDRLTLFYIIDAIVERAAKLVAINIASVVQKSGRGKNPAKPVCITADGSTFYKSKLLRNKIEYYVKDYLENQKELYCEFVKADNVTLVGTAIAGLLG